MANSARALAALFPTDMTCSRLLTGSHDEPCHGGKVKPRCSGQACVGEHCSQMSYDCSQHENQAWVAIGGTAFRCVSAPSALVVAAPPGREFLCARDRPPHGGTCWIATPRTEAAYRSRIVGSFNCRQSGAVRS